MRLRRASKGSSWMRGKAWLAAGFVNAALERHHAQRRFGLVAQARPLRMIGRGRIQARVVAQRRRREQALPGQHASVPDGSGVKSPFGS